MSSGRKWAFRLLALTVTPLLMLGALEVGLRLIGFGYSTAFFRTISANGARYVVENDRFTWRFFPRHLARRPLPVKFSPSKPEGTYRVFLMGESAAMGDPEPAFGMGRVLEALLRDRFPHARFEIINVAFTAINSHVILPIARDCAKQNADLWVVYMGHNEVQGPMGPGTIFGAHRSRLWLLRAALALKSSRIGQALEALQTRWYSSTTSQKTWRGLEMFLNNQFRRDDPRLQSMYSHFRRNLEDILQSARGSGAEVILCTPASNLGESAPFASLHKAGFSAAQQAAWEKPYQAAVAAESEGQYAAALRWLQDCAALDSEFAETQFRTARCARALDQPDSARSGFELARDLDTLRFRADSKLHRIIEETASAWQGRGVYFRDTRRALQDQAPDGNPGAELFFDHVHLKFAGNYWVARAVAEEMMLRLPAALRTADSGSWADQAGCAALLALTEWFEYQLHDTMQRRLLEPPFTNQINHRPRQQHYFQKLVDLRPALDEAGVLSAVQVCREAIGRWPDDPYLHENLGRMLAASGDAEGALAAYRRVASLWPHHPVAHSNIGSLLSRLNRLEEAEQGFRRALAFRPDFAEAHHGLGNIYTRRGDLDRAVASYESALAANPELVEAQVDLGRILQDRGKLAEAERWFLEAVRTRPSYVPARLALADLLMGEGEVFEAIPHLTEATKAQPQKVVAMVRGAVELNPDDPQAQLKLANVLATLGQTEESLRHLQRAVRLDTSYWQARYLLGVEFASQNRLAEAQEQFAGVVRLRPEYARAHLNLGVALARQMRLAEAAAHFSEVLRLESTNQQALQYLQTIKSLTNRSPAAVR